MNWNVIIREGLWMGLAFSVLMTLLVVIGLLWNKEIFFDDYPADVKAKWGPMSEKGKQQRILYTALLLSVMATSMIFAAFRLTAALGSAPSFLEMFACVAILFSIFNLFDAFIIDLLLLTKLWPTLGVLPGTEGMAGYTDMKLWTNNLFKGVVIAPMMGLIAAAVTSLVIWIGTML
jgi:hypothetical protein